MRTKLLIYKARPLSIAITLAGPVIAQEDARAIALKIA
jgi:hypothetical protein